MPAMYDWDLVIVGAGPAGASAAIAARQSEPRARVLLLDAASFPRDKVCGDGVAPHALDVLARLGVDSNELVAGSDPVTRLRLRSPGGSTATRLLARPAYVVPRLIFDDRLVRAATGAGAVFEQRAVRSITVLADAVLLDDQIRARTLIGADGSESIVRRLSGASRPPMGTVALALRGYASADPWPAGEQLLTMTSKHWPAYAWAFPIGNGVANVGYGELLQGAPSSRAHMMSRLHELLPDAVPGSLRGHRLPLSTGRPKLASGPVLLAGDAASLINPLTGEGIFYAVLSGSLAGAAALTPHPARTYRHALRLALGRHLRHTDALARLGHWPALLDAAISAARDAQPVFDSLVEIGLGAGLLRRRAATAVARRIVRPGS